MVVANNGPTASPCIGGLRAGTPHEMPVPAKELGVKSEALYTFGGATNPLNSVKP